jgi:hypothetical protein
VVETEACGLPPESDRGDRERRHDGRSEKA